MALAHAYRSDAGRDLLPAFAEGLAQAGNAQTGRGLSPAKNLYCEGRDVALNAPPKGIPMSVCSNLFQYPDKKNGFD
jgi:hypothetical protein